MVYRVLNGLGGKILNKFFGQVIWFKIGGIKLENQGNIKGLINLPGKKGTPLLRKVLIPIPRKLGRGGGNSSTLRKEDGVGGLPKKALVNWFLKGYWPMEDQGTQEFSINFIPEEMRG